MKSIFKVFRTWPVIFLLFSIVATRPGNVQAQDQTVAAPDRDTLIAVARELMSTVQYCALITLDETGQPHARMMDSFPPEDNMVVWLATNPNSRKVRQIHNDPRVTLYYAFPDEGGYVAITGTAQIVDDPGEQAKHWKEGWEFFYPNPEKDFILIKVSPKQLDVLSNMHGIPPKNLETWRTHSVEF